ncbi:MAG TPA: methyltransferase [Pyrinomonadaceae bacterium]|nr:methyltransferase [Pyrinomonadaceae bacterium]
MSTTVLATNQSAASQPEPFTAAPSMPPEAALTQLITGGLGSQAVYVAAQLGIADLLVTGPRSAEDLAKAASVDGPSLYRVLRALASFGVFTERPDGLFELTPTAELLRSDSPKSLRHLAIFMGEDWHWRVWGRTLYSVRTGNAAWAQEHGCDAFPFLAANPEAAKIFDQAMTSLSNLAIKAVIEAYDFSGFETLVDVAGGQGRLLSAILQANPGVKGILFDQPHVIQGAGQTDNLKNLDGRCQLVAGDFFTGVPAGADAYIMKHIIHDWDDERALRILKNIRSVMRDDGRVLLIESVITPGNTPDFGKLLDIEMLVSPGGKERTATEYAELFEKAGLRLTHIVATKSPYSVIEAVKIR